MTDCSKIPTLALVEDSKKGMDDIVSFSGSTADTFVSQLDGKTKLTMQGISKSLQGKDIGDYEDDLIISRYDEYVVFERSTNPSKWTVKSSTPTPYQIDSTTYPNPSQDPNLTPFTGGGSVIPDHNDLNGRDVSDCHPAESVTMSDGKTVEQAVRINTILAS